MQNTRFFTPIICIKHCKHWYLLVFICFWFPVTLFSQSFQSKADSLSALLKETSHDTIKLEIYNTLFHYYASIDPKELLHLTDKALSLSKKHNRKPDIANWYGNKAVHYRLQNNPDSALYYQLKALKINEQLKDRKNISKNIINIGLIYYDIKNYDKALSLMRQGIAVKQELNDKPGLMKAYINIGIVFYALKQLDSAKAYYSRSLKIATQLRDDKGIFLNKMNIGSIYFDQKNWEEAKNYYEEALKLCEETGDMEARAAVLINIGLVCKEQKDYENSILYLKSAITVARETGSKSDLSEASYNLSEVYKLNGNYKEAYTLHKQYSKNKEEIQKNAKGVADIQTNYEVEKKEAIIEEKDESILRQTGIRKKLIWGSSILVLILLSVSGFMYVQKQKLVVDKKQIQLENKVLGQTNLQMKARMQKLVKVIEERKQHHNPSALEPEKKYRTSTLTVEERQQCIDTLLDYMDAEKPYLDPELTLHSLGEALSIKPHHLSEVLNEALGRNFYDFINMYRIEEVKEKMASPESSKLKLLALAFDAGFNSKTAFNRAFKKATGLPPSRYRQKHVEQQQPLSKEV